MSRIYPQTISKGEDLVSHPFYETPVVSARKIRAADGSGEQGVTGEDRAGCMKRDPSRRMARSVDDRDPVLSKFYLHSFCKMAIRRKTQP
jgi:hypothetical protein